MSLFWIISLLLVNVMFNLKMKLKKYSLVYLRSEIVLRYRYKLALMLTISKERKSFVSKYLLMRLLANWLAKNYPLLLQLSKVQRESSNQATLHPECNISEHQFLEIVNRRIDYDNKREFENRGYAGFFKDHVV